MNQVYGYVRWSSDRQEDGDTRRRQMSLIEGWLSRHKNCKLDTSLGAKGLFIDEGMTGFADGGSRNLDNYQLGALIKLAESGRIERGSFLLVENTDRISRESSVFALNLITRLLCAGIVVVTLAPEKEFRSDADLAALLPVLVGADRAHDESKTKKHRASKAWSAKREAVAEGTQILSTRVPAWCRVVGASRKNNRLVGGKIEPVREHVAVVKRLFQLAKNGDGCRVIANKLNGEGVPTFTGKSRWGQARIFQILKSRAVLGEYQPHVGVQGSKKKGRSQTRTASGEAVKDYYPRVIDDKTFADVNESLIQRASFRGRRTSHVNLFAGLLVDARTGEHLTYSHHTTGASTICGNSDSRGIGAFNSKVFETGILEELRELPAEDVFKERDTTGEIARLSASLTEKRDERDEVKQSVAEKPKLLRSVGDQLIKLEDEVEELTTALKDAQRRAASPLSEVWGEFQSVASLLATDNSSETRQRVQTLIRGLISRVVVLIIGKGRVKRKRVAYVQVDFKGGAARIYEIAHIHKGPHHTKESWSGGAGSYRHEPGQHERDLRKDWPDIERWILDQW